MNYLETERAGIIVAQRHPSYQDVPGKLYHFPAVRYRDRMEQLQGCLVLLYEPRRGGARRGATHGGRSAFTGVATIGAIRMDDADPTHAYADLVGFLDLPRVVPLSETPFSGNSLQAVVRVVDAAPVLDILRKGLAPIVLQDSATVREGMVEVRLPELELNRPVREFLSRRPVRDAAFRLKVVENVYDGRCALTGIRMLNGNGRAEVDAAHIRPVEAGGPDSIRNGIALSKTMHWVFDRGLVSISDAGGILLVERGVDPVIQRLLPVDGQAILPKHREDRPHPEFLRWHRENVFKGVA